MFTQFTRQSRHFLVPLEKIVEKPVEEDFKVKHEIGRGGYGVCKIVQHLKSHKFFVAKIINKSKTTDGDAQFVINEIHVLANLKHKNIVGLDKVYIEKGNFTLITEFCFYGSLENLTRKKKNVLGEGERRHIIHGLLNGAKYLHNKNILHGDIKPLNVFISKELVAKLGDFGMAHYVYQEDIFGGTLLYFAPEVFNTREEKHTTKTDIWAIGCTAYFVYTGEDLFATEGDRTPVVRRNIYRNIRHGDWYNLPFEVRSFIYLMTQRDPQKRPECSSLVRHPFLMRRAKRFVSSKVLQNLVHNIIDPYS